MSKLTLEEIARLAELSRSTVSRVINNQPNVKPAIRGKILKVVAETGYHPDPATRSLAGRRTGVIIQASQLGDPLITQMVEHQVPFVMIGRPTGPRLTRL